MVLESDAPLKKHSGGCRCDIQIVFIFSAFLLCWLKLNHVYREGCASSGGLVLFARQFMKSCVESSSGYSPHHRGKPLL